jgi:Ni2+-binding GTPase involved in maturation of urease and hydrogenase
MTENKKVRIVMIAGLSGSGKTQLIYSLLKNINTDHIGIIVNNVQSEKELKKICNIIDNFPVKTPCARPRQYRYRIEKMLDENDLDLIITEPPGFCSETSAPVLNPLIIFKKDSIDVGPLITIVDYISIPTEGISKNITDGLKLFNLIFESDCIIVRKNGSLSKEQKEQTSFEITQINPDAKILFISSTDNNIKLISDKIFSDEKYLRPLVN